MRCPSCNHDNRDGAKFCEDCATPLAERCATCGATLRAGAKFCDECAAPTRPLQHRDRVAVTPRHLADKILNGRAALVGERKHVTVLFADVKGSMDLAEQVDPEQWHRIMDRFFQIITAGIHRFEGTVNQYAGDGIMALFGAPIAHEDHAQRACYAALHLRDELRRYADELRVDEGLSFSVRMGLNSGDVVVGTIGDDLRMEYTAQGHTVGLAARMEQLAEPGKALLTEHTARLVAGYFTLRDLGRSRVKGVSEPLAIHELESAGALRTRLDVSRARGFSRLVGRAGDLVTMNLALERALAGNGQVIGVVGEAGVGKSRLCFDFIEACRAKGLEVLEAHCPAHGKTVPYLPLLELLRNYFGIGERDTAAEARKKIAGTLVLLDAAFQETLPLVFDFLGVPDPEQPLPRVDPEMRQRQLFRFARQLVQSRPQDPGVILVDDLHWVDPASDAFLAQIVEAIPATRTLLLVNFRPEYHAGWMSKSYYQQVPLLPLGADATAELVHELVGDDPSLARIAERIHARTGGNPFFIEEVVHALVETGSLAGVRGRYRLVGPVSDLAIPQTVQSVLAARIDRLAKREKALLQTAAVIGKEFAEPVLRRVLALLEGDDGRAADVAAALAALADAEFVYEAALYPESTYAFKHPLTQEVTYRTQLSDRRARVHGAVAQVLIDVHHDKLEEAAALVAHHWENAGNALEAARWHRRAAEWAGTSNVVEALGHWQRVRELTHSATESPERAEFQLAACTQLLNFGTRRGMAQEEARALFAEGKDVAGRAGDTGGLCGLHLTYADVSFNGCFDDDPVQVHLDAIRLAEEAGDRELQVIGWCYLSFVHGVLGNCAEALRLSNQAKELAREDPTMGVASVGVNMYVWLGYFQAWLLAMDGPVTVSVPALEAARDLARENGELETLAWVHVTQAIIAYYVGDAATATTNALRATEVAEKIGNLYARVWALVATGRAQLLVEQWSEAARAFQAARELARARRVTLYAEGWMLAGLAEAELGRGDLAAARRAAEQAVVVSSRWRHLQTDPHLTLARVLLRVDGASAAAEVTRHLDEAAALTENAGTRLLAPLVRLARADLAGLGGDETARRFELREAHRLWLHLGADGPTARVAALLASVGDDTSAADAVARNRL